MKILCNAVRQGSYHSGARWKTMVVISSKTLCRGWECGNVSTFTACFQRAVVVTRVLICVERSCWPFLHWAVIMSRVLDNHPFSLLFPTCGFS